VVCTLAKCKGERLAVGKTDWNAGLCFGFCFAIEPDSTQEECLHVAMHAPPMGTNYNNYIPPILICTYLETGAVDNFKLKIVKFSTDFLNLI
jgi:hypothetical protein